MSPNLCLSLCLCFFIGHQYAEGFSIFPDAEDSQEFNPFEKHVNEIVDTYETQLTGSSDWGYDSDNGPSSWSETYPTCGGTRQSPINIDEESTTHIVRPQLRWKNYGNDPTSWTVTNNGHSVQVQGEWADDSSVPRLSGGPLRDTYIFYQFHFHWGAKKSRGSEHTVNQKSFPMEGHFVHYNAKYGSYENAANQTDGLMVFGVFFKVAQESDISYEILTSTFPEIRKSGASTTTFGFILNSLLPKKRNSRYYSYDGSLTTPPCTENVKWLVSPYLLRITKKELENFRKLRNDDLERIEDNFRPIQPLYGRKVYLVTPGTQ